MDGSKFGKGGFQEDILSRARCTIMGTPFEKVSVVDCQRSLAKSIFKFSRVKFGRDNTREYQFMEQSEEFFTILCELLKETTDYPTQCYLMGALNNFYNLGYFDNQILMQCIWNVLKGSHYLNCEKMKIRDQTIGWKTKVPLIPELGWKANCRWIQLDEKLEGEFHETDLRLEHLAKFLHSTVLKIVTQDEIKEEEKLQSKTMSQTSGSSSANSKPSTHICECCSKPCTKKCSQCHAAYFCSQECMKKMWPKHKLVCKK